MGSCRVDVRDAALEKTLKDVVSVLCSITSMSSYIIYCQNNSDFSQSLVHISTLIHFLHCSISIIIFLRMTTIPYNSPRPALVLATVESPANKAEGDILDVQKQEAKG